MKTIKELADICGVSKVAITKWLEKNGYTERLEKVGNKFVLDDTVADEVIRAYTARREKKKAEPINTSTAEKPLTEDITALLAILREQLEQKDAEINRLYQQVENLQATNLDLTKAIREANAISYQAMLSEPEKPEKPMKEAENREDLTEQPRKKSFWDWFRR